MIPADHVIFDGDTAWWVLPWTQASAPPIANLDRPCDEYACNDGSWLDGDGDIVCDCEECHGSGRHTFDIEVRADYYIAPMHHHVLADVHRVSIVPGMVLPIVDGNIAEELDRNDRHIMSNGDGTFRFYEAGWWDHPNIDDDYLVTLPPAAKPGMWAVKLKVAL